MVQHHPSTPEQRAQWTATMLAQPRKYGVIARLSRESGVSRPTLYAWRAQAEQALIETFTPSQPAPITPTLARQVLTIWSAHSSDRDIQTCFRVLTQQGIGLATITAILADADQRALQWFATHMPPTTRAIALDELYANDRQGAYLTIADAHSGAVWASSGPVPADSDSWTLLLWQVQENGLLYDRAVMDAGRAARAACQRVHPALPLQGDQWHVLHTWSQVQGRLERIWRAWHERTAVVERQAARVAAGLKPLGRNPQTDVSAHALRVARARRVADDLRYLGRELHRLLCVVVLDHRGVLDGAQRQAELDSLLVLLTEVAEGAEAPMQGLVRRLLQVVTDALPGLLTFVEHVVQVQSDLQGVMGAEQQALLGWAWLRRHELGWESAQIVAAMAQEWQAAARVLVAAWDDAVRVSTAVERWHSILRMHLSVHRTLSPGRLALLVVWHNHRVFTRGIHKGYNPLHLSGMADAPTDWLVALGYPSATANEAPAPSACAMPLAA